MKKPLNHLWIAPALLALATLNPVLSTAFAQGTAFTYQGRLNNNGTPANGSYDLTFSLYKTPIGGGSPAAGPLTNSATTVTNGLFTVTLDFGSGVFTGQNYFMQINVETNGVGPYVPLSPRQQLTPTPYAIYSENAGAANSVISNGVSVAQLNTLDEPTNGEVLTYNGTSLVWSNPPSGGSSGWSLAGNSGAGAFLGTTNDYPLYLVADSITAGTFWPFANGSVSVALGPDNYFTTSGNGGNFMAGGGNSSTPNFIYADNSSIGGGYNNQISAGSPESVIAGGSGQRISSSASATIGGGGYNTVSNATLGTIPGGWNNLVSGNYGFAAGNFAQAIHPGAFVWADDSSSVPFASTSNNQFSARALGGVRFVTGGAGMTIDGVPVGTSGGGGGSNANYTISTVQTTNSGLDSSAMGYQNTASGNYSTVAGGWGNTASGIGSFVGGGGYDGFTVGGNTAQYGAATVVGGISNSAASYGATVVGGYNNVANNTYSLVGGGANNAAGGEAAFVGAGLHNSASGLAATIPGGNQNLASGTYSFAAGNNAQAVNQGAFVWADSEATVFSSTAIDQFSVRAANGMRIVTGGNGLSGLTLDGYQVLTTASGGGGGGGITNAWLLTGNNGANPANGYFLGTMDTNALELHVKGQRALRLEYSGTDNQPNVIGGSSLNSVLSGIAGAAIGGGLENTNNANYATIGGGANNRIGAGNWATISGGWDNTASGEGATIPGGVGNVANGTGSFAAGFSAKANDNNSFVWGDGSRAAGSQGAGSFSILATGGIYLYTTTAGTDVALDNTGDLDFGTTTRQMLNLWSTLYGIGVQSSTLYQRTAAGGGFAWFAGGVHTNAQDNPGGGTTVMTLDGSGNLNVTANASVCSLTIRGGCDLAEPFQISSTDQEIPQGAVVVIDEENPGHLKLSGQPYDTRVAGVVSGANGVNPGIQMQQEGLLEGGKNVALTGRVYVQAEASNGAIRPGDLLTTSATPGRAMKVTDHAKAQGAILGKAMTTLSEGQGMVLVLVTLQ